MTRKIRFNINDFKGISRMDDFYSGIPEVKDALSSGVNVGNVFMSQKACEQLLDYMLGRVSPESITRFSWVVECSHDWLCNSPSTYDKRVPDDEVWITT